MNRIQSTIVFCDFRRIRFAGMSSETAIELCRDVVDYACHIADRCGVKAVGVFSLVPSSMVRAELLGTQILSDSLMRAFDERLKDIESVAVLEGMGAASEIPADLKEVCGRNFRTVLPFSGLFDRKASTDVARRFAALRSGIDEHRFGRACQTRGSRTK